MLTILKFVRPRSFIQLIFALAFLQFTPFYAQAQYFSGPSTTALGGTGRASLDPIESAFLNPATLTHGRGYHFGTFYTDSNDLEKGNFRDFSVAIADSTPDKILPAALRYTQRRIFEGSGQAPIDQTDLHLAVADEVVGQLTVGLGFHWLGSEIAGVKHNQFNTNIGFLYNPADNLGIGLVFYDLIGAGSEMPAAVDLKRTVAMAVTYVYAEFIQGRLDISHQLKDNPDNKSKIMVGIDSKLAEFFALRLGAQWDDLNKQTFLSGGFGFVGPRLGIDYAVQKEMQNSSDGLRHLMSARLSL